MTRRYWNGGPDGVNTLRISDLAQMFFETENSRNARRRMLYLLTNDPWLWEELLKRHFRKRQEFFTPLQYELLVEVYGFPPFVMAAPLF